MKPEKSMFSKPKTNDARITNMRGSYANTSLIRDLEKGFKFFWSRRGGKPIGSFGKPLDTK